MNRHFSRLLGHYLAAAFLAPPEAVVAPAPGAPGPAPADADGFQTPDWSSVDFSSPPASDGSDSFDGGSDESLPPVRAETPPIQPTPLPGVAPVPQAPVAPAPAPTAPVAAQPTPQVDPQQPQPTTPQPNPLDDPAYEATTVANLANGYKLSPEQTERVLTEPEAVLPELAGRLHYNMVLSNAAMIDQHMTQFRERVLPGLIREAITQHATTTTVAQNVERDIFTPYPELKAVPQPTLKLMAQTVDAMMPGKTGQEKLQALVTQVYTLRGLPIPGFTPTPQQPVPVAPIPPRPWSPVNPGAMPAPPPGPVPQGTAEAYWDQFNEKP